VALTECIVARTGKPVLVDSSKIGVRLKYLLRNPALDVRVIRLVRDGRAVALTYVDPDTFADAADPALRGGGTGDTRRRRRLSMSDAARQWRRSIEEGAAVVRTLGASRWTEVRYEELCTEPRATLDRLFTFIGVVPPPTMSAVRPREQHVIGNGMRLNSVVEIRLDDRWQSALSFRDLEEFDAVAGRLNRAFGYL
jgi:hypothetical protein